MALWQDGDLVMEEGKIHYYRTGGTKPPFVLLHGFADDGLCWTRTAEALENDYDVIMPDARGHGLSSDFPPHKFTLKEMAIDLIKLFQKLGLKAPIVLGHSMGARVAAYVAAAAPPLVGKLILIDPEWSDELFNATKEDRASKAEVCRNRIRSWKNMTPQQIIVELRRSQPINWHKTEYTTWAEAKQRVSPNVSGLILADPVALQEIIPKITCPTLLFYGDTSAGAIMDEKRANAIAQMNPKIKLYHVPQASHEVHRDKFDVFIQAVREFLAS